MIFITKALEGDVLPSKKKFILKIAMLLVMYAPIIPSTGCISFWWGEPQLPEKIKKEDVVGS